MVWMEKHLDSLGSWTLLTGILLQPQILGPDAGDLHS